MTNLVNMNYFPDRAAQNKRIELSDLKAGGQSRPGSSSKRELHGWDHWSIVIIVMMMIKVRWTSAVSLTDWQSRLHDNSAGRW